MEITKSICQKYHLHDSYEYALIFLDCEDDKPNGTLSIQSSYGTWAYSWYATGSTFKQFLIGLNQDYLFNKLTHRNEFNYEKTLDIIELDIHQCFKASQINKEGKKNALEQLKEWRKESFRTADEFYHASNEYLQTNYILDSKIYESFRDLPFSKDFPRAIYHFHERFWNAFIEQLKSEQKC